MHGFLGNNAHVQNSVDQAIFQPGNEARGGGGVLIKQGIRKWEMRNGNEEMEIRKWQFYVQ